MVREKAQGVVVTTHPVFVLARRRIVDLAANLKLPAIYGLRGFSEIGGLMSYGLDTVDVGRHAAVYVDKILRGAKPADLPVEQPTKVALVINLKTARALGLEITPLLFARADEVIE
jgi:putative ABC transport system substrate-binding protein